MKRFFLFLAVVFLVMVSGYLLTRHLETGVALTEYVPADSLALLEWRDPAGALAGFRATRVGRCLEEIDWDGVMRGLGMPEERIRTIRRQLAQVSFFVNGPMFGELFGGSVVAALLPPQQGTTAAAGPARLRQEVVLLARPRHGAAAARLVRTLLQGGDAIRVAAYQGIDLYRLRTLFATGPLYLAVRDDLLVLASAMAPVRRCLDLVLARMVHAATGMGGSRVYQRLRKRTRGRDDCFLYLDVAALKSSFPAHGAPLPAAVAGGAASLSSGARGIQKAVFFHQPFNDVQQFTSIVEFDTDQLAPFQATIYSRPPMENRRIAGMPANLLVYFWTNWLDLPDWWRSTLRRSRRRERETARRVAAWVEQVTGRDMDSALAMFGQEFGLNIVEIITSGFFPVPRICLCVEMADPVAIRSVLDALLKGVPVRREVIRGVPVVSIMAAGGLMQPSYALLDRYLVLSDGRDQIEAILQPSGKMLLDDPDFRKVDMGLLQANNLVVFARTAALVDGMKELASWLGTIVAIRDGESAAGSKVLIDKVVLPLLESMKMFRAVGIRSYTGQGELVLRWTVLEEQ